MPCPKELSHSDDVTPCQPHFGPAFPNIESAILQNMQSQQPPLFSADQVAAGSDDEEKVREDADNTTARSEAAVEDTSASSSGAVPSPSIHSLSTEEWRRLYEPDGYVDLWVEEEFNSGSRIVVSFAAAESNLPVFSGNAFVTAGETQSRCSVACVRYFHTWLQPVRARACGILC